ncbi:MULTISPECIES: response regulator transcription factor [unclassified Pseudomonas]|uniref:response regulator transcription factor n=1 Tax=unclassified Pseudomonas TaxID=196821 RepID=UPI000A1F905B|nr:MULTISPECIES: response regulator transcription factor [unclassified Pseudomonas]
MKRALIVDDHPVVGATLGLILESEGFRQVEVVASGVEAVPAIRRLSPELVILDLNLKGMSGLEVLERIRANGLDCRVVVFTSHEPAHYQMRCMRAGAMAYVTKSDSLHQLRNAIKAVRSGYTYFPGSTDLAAGSGMLQNNERQLIDLLSDRELHILVQLAQGRANKDIAEGMSLSHKTVSTYKTRLMTKLGVGSLVLLREFALRNQLI